MDLIVDTSSEELKVILLNNKDYVINKETGVKHLEHLLPEIDRLLNENNKELKDVKNYAVVVGPGSFTGIRIGVATVKGFCSVFSKSKIIEINMLDLLSYVVINGNNPVKKDYAIIIKSTATKYYFGKYSASGKCLEQKLCSKEDVANEFEKVEKIFSYNFEESFNNYKTKKIILMPGNYISYVENKKQNKEFTTNLFGIISGRNRTFEKREMYMIEIVEVNNNNVNNSLIKNLFEIHKEVFLDFDQMSFDNFTKEFKQNNRIYLIAKLKDEVVGYIGVINCVDCFEIIGIGVKAEQQGSGIGSCLLKNIFKIAKEKSIEKIFLEVDEKNTKAQSFYKKFDFEITNIRKKYYKDNDALVMMRKI